MKSASFKWLEVILHSVSSPGSCLSLMGEQWGANWGFTQAFKIADTLFLTREQASPDPFSISSLLSWTTSTPVFGFKVSPWYPLLVNPKDVTCLSEKSDPRESSSSTQPPSSACWSESSVTTFDILGFTITSAWTFFELSGGSLLTFPFITSSGWPFEILGKYQRIKLWYFANDPCFIVYNLEKMLIPHLDSNSSSDPTPEILSLFKTGMEEIHLALHMFS